MGKYRFGYLLEDLTQSEAKQVLRYSPLDGTFTRLSGPRAGQIAGAINPHNGNIQIRVYGRLYLAHRLAWLYVTGAWPTDEIDHRDGRRSNNRWSNIRPATHAENHQNEKVRADNTSGMTGIDPCSRGWQVRIQLEKERLHLGYYLDLNEAKHVRAKAKRRYHKFQPTQRA